MGGQELLLSYDKMQGKLASGLNHIGLFALIPCNINATDR